jgi:hypothetical protein
LFRFRSKPRGRAALSAFTASVLLGAFVWTAPARADDGTPAPVAADRATLVQAWENGGPQVRSLAEVALTGTDDQVRDFLNNGLTQAALVDQREAVTGAMLDAGPSVRAAAQAAVDAYDGGDTTALSTFLSSGRLASQDIDLRVRVNELMATGGPRVQAAAQAALDSEDPAVLQTFVDSGWQTSWQTDLRLQVNQAMAGGGPEVKAAAQKALDAGTTQAYDQFLSYDWDVAQAHDDETADISGLLALAQESAATVDRETKNAQDQAKRAADAAAGAKRSADIAAAATQAAKNDAAQAKAHAQRAARAARQAQQAAQVALDAAAAAARATQAAIKAANRAYWAAGKAASAANDAYHSAAQALIDRAYTGAAKKAADNAIATATATQDLAERAKQAATALQAMQSAMTNSDAASYNAQAAADSSDQAQKYANQTGAAASEAKAAAAAARADAQRALAAMAAARKYMQIAIDNALAARDAAVSAAANANKAAKAAQDAVAFAGTAAQAAVKATDAATAAVAAANEVVDLGVKALDVFNAARQADTDRLQAATAASAAAAAELNAQYEAAKQQADWDADQATKRDAETIRLIAEARNPGTPTATAVADSRKAALALAQKPGEWTRQAALDALGADDDLEVLSFVRSRLDGATAQDNRVAVQEIADSDNVALSKAALAANAGSDADVATFLATQNYSGRMVQDRQQVNQILAAAKTAGRTLTAQRAQAALDDGSSAALRDFLSKGQYQASATDDRVKANQLIASPDTGPEVKAAAQVALEGPPTQLVQFLASGQFEAAERDNASSVHIATVAGLMEQVYQLGATSVQHAQEAQSSAAKARGDATAAANYANQAIDSANKARGYANTAADWANKAAVSAANAVHSADTARNAAMAADKSADTAIRNAAWAAGLHEQAKRSAKAAKSYADQAAKAAKDAGKDAEAAQADSDAADAKWRSAVATEAVECYAANHNELSSNLSKLLTGKDDTAKNCLLNALGDPDEVATRAWGNVTWCKVLYPQGMASQDFKNCRDNVLDPNFGWMSLLEFGGSIVLGLSAMLAPALITAGVGCILIEPCGAVVGTLLSLGDFGATLYGLIKGDVSFSDALKDLGTDLLENLAFAGAVKLASTTYRGLKSVLALNKAAKRAEDTLTTAGVRNVVLNVTLSCGKNAVLNSFAPSTPVLLADRTTEPISQIQVGDRVLSTDPTTGSTVAEPVTDLITSEDTELTDLGIRQESGESAVLHTTAHHPFWNPDAGRWLDAGDLAPGARLLTSDGENAEVTSANTFAGRQEMHNLTVADLHTYYVLAGAEPLLVHNAAKCPFRGSFVDYASTDLSIAAARLRFDLNVGSGRNVAAFKLKDGKTIGGKNIVAAPSTGEDNHSEINLDQILKDNHLTWNDVEGLYSERAVCDPCSAVIPDHVDITYTFPYLTPVKVNGKVDPVITDINKGTTKDLWDAYRALLVKLSQGWGQ